jgi:pyruvate dehydrogenase E2 component (dihydrolipoamide acetyltransferase)
MTRLAIRMPKMSMTMTEGEVSSWMVDVGAEVSEGDVVCEVMTDKVDMEVESTVSGTLVEIVVPSGTVEVGEPIGWVEGEDTGGGFGDLLSEPQPDALPEPAAVPGQVGRPSNGVPAAEAPAAETPATVLPAEPQPPAAPAAAPAAPSGPVAAVPRARALAAERGIDLATVTGSGPDGLIRVADIEALAPSKAPAPVPEPTPAPKHAAPVPAMAETPPAAAPAAPPAPAARATAPAPDRKAAIRGAVARKMTPSAAIPQFTVWREIELDAANTLRRGVSWTTVLLRAYAAALRDVPDLLCRWENDRATESGPPSIALAVATDRGLLVPTFLEPDLGDAKALDTEIRAVVKAAHTGKLPPAYMGVANGSLSNLGGLGVDQFQALLTPPQASVLSLGSIRQRPVAVPGGVGLALTVNAGLTVDHRVADGAHAAELLDRFARRLAGDL